MIKGGGGDSDDIRVVDCLQSPWVCEIAHGEWQASGLSFKEGGVGGWGVGH